MHARDIGELEGARACTRGRAGVIRPAASRDSTPVHCPRHEYSVTEIIQRTPLFQIDMQFYYIAALQN